VHIQHVSSTLRFHRPLPGTLRASVQLIGVVLIAGLVAQAIGGTTASITVGLAAGSAMTYGTVMPTRVAAVVTLVGGAAAALGAAVSGDPWLSGFAVAAMVLITAPASAYSAGALMLAPLLTMVFAVVDRGWPWWQAGIWGVVGGLVGLLIAGILRFGKRPPVRLPWRVAWRHATVVAIAAGASIVLAESLSLGHGYWVAVTILVVLRPLPEERTGYIIQRIWGTLLGAFIALVTIWLVPSGWLMPAALVFLVVLAAYAMSGNYFLQTAFLTPMLMIFMSANDKGTAIELTIGRVLYTVVGVLIAALLAWVMHLTDRRTLSPRNGKGQPAARPEPIP
jgi:hypothetical protein